MCLKGEVSMVVRKRPVTKNSPCPICGKPDYCWWKEREDHPGFYNLYCNRTSEAKGTIVSGVDGNDYVAIFEKDPGTIYQNIREREEMFGKSIEGEAVKSATPRNCVVIDAVEPLEHERLDQAYRTLLSILPLYDYHVKYLISEGWNNGGPGGTASWSNVSYRTKTYTFDSIKGYTNPNSYRFNGYVYILGIGE